MHHMSRAKPIAIWGVSGLLTALYLFSGGSKLLDFQPGGGVAEAAGHFGYPVAFMYFVGACEVAGAVGLLIPRLATLAAAGLSILMLGAFVSHLQAGDPMQNAVAPLIALVLLIVVALARRDALLSRGASQSPG